MYKFDLRGLALKDLEGNPFPDSPLMKDLIASCLANKSDGADPVKLYELALRIKQGQFELDTSDLDLVLEALRNTSSLTALAKGQILLELKKQGG